jgi:glycosyltransferase involved in cell wall biosynthesis
VIEPAIAARPPRRRYRGGPLRRVAFVGAVQPHKGALVFEELVGMLDSADGGSRLRWSVFGGGDREILGRLRRMPRVAVRGYYRAGALPALLVRHRIDLALLLSVVPESYGFTLGECRLAGVPVIAFDHGAFAARIREDGCGVLVPLAEGASGVARALTALGRANIAPVPPPWRVWDASEADERTAALYAQLS